NANVTLAVVKEYKRDRISQYTVRYVKIDTRLESRLRGIIVNHINKSNTVEEYTYDCPEPEEDQVRAINYEETDFYRIFEQLSELNPEEDVIEGVEELVKSKAYMIILRNTEGIQVIGFKTLPENWRLKKNRGLIPLLFNEDRFEDLEQENIFSISSIVDLFYFNELLFILSKKDFERGLNFREGMINNAEEMYREVTQLNIFVNMEILTNKVGNNQRYLRKIATIRNLGHYRNPVYLLRLQQLSAAKGWNLQFESEQIVITDETLEDILTLLQNKRLHSELTEEDFDVESTKPVSVVSN
ncbi:MAG: DUF4868 domain-containing protein, partial [Parapedobacter sp.]